MRNSLLLILLGCCALSGCGGGGSPSVSLSTKTLTFGDEVQGTTSEPLPITLTNSGTATLTITSIAASANFAQTNNCGSTLAAGANCIISVTLAPTISGSASGTVSFTDNAAGSPQTVSLSGTGTAPSTLDGTCVITPGPLCTSIGDSTQCPVGNPAVSLSGYSCVGMRGTFFVVDIDTSSPCGTSERGFCEATTLSAGSCSVQGQQCGAADSSPCCSGFVCTAAADGSFCQPATGETASRARSSWDKGLADRLR